MKKVFLSLFVIFIFLISCKKENPNENPEDNIIVGGVYMNYTDISENTCDIAINISGETFSFNKLEAVYSSFQPTANQNVFNIYLTDTVTNKWINLNIFTKYIQPEGFFVETTINTDSIRISWSGVTEDFFDADATLTWYSVSFNDNKFTGKATLEITKKMEGMINTNTYYPEQKLDFEFE